MDKNTRYAVWNRAHNEAVEERYIPAGTGAMMNQLREVAVKRDALILEEREKDAAKAAAKAEAAAAPALPPAE